MTAPVRYSTRPLPRTAFVPGMSRRTDRPTSPIPRPVLPDFDALGADEEFRYGVDLFNHGYPWEAHETWEPLWFAAPRDRPERPLLQGLIHAAAAAVKAKAGATNAARGFVDSACGHLALATTDILDVEGLIAALNGWLRDPTQPTPSIVLAAPTAPPDAPTAPPDAGA